MNLHVPVNLLGLPVATQQTTQDPHAAHPGQLLRHTGVGCTLSLTWGKELGRHVNFIVHTDLHHPGWKMYNKLQLIHKTGHQILENNSLFIHPVYTAIQMCCKFTHS